MKHRDIVDVAPCSKEPSNLQSLAALRKLERDPIHKWDEDERELLTVSYRWYINTDPSTIPRVFNAINGLDLRLSVVRYQFEGHMLLYGGRAFPEFARAMAVPFHDAEGRYDEIHLIIEDTAAESGIDLSRRKAEINFNSGTARYAKSPRTRRNYKSLIRRAVLKEKERFQAVLHMAQEPPIVVPSLGGVALNMDSEQEDEEIWSNAEDYTNLVLVLSGPRPAHPPCVHHIAFQVWDANSRTIFYKDARFVSQAFATWRNDYPPPFSLDGQGRQALMLLINLRW